MRNFKIQLVKWLANKFGYKVAIVKVKDYCITVEGDLDLITHIKEGVMEYADSVGFGAEYVKK